MHQRCQTGYSGPPRPPANVVQLSSYRRRAQFDLRDAKIMRTEPAPRPSIDDGYAERMKVNAALFVLTILLIVTGVWLVDGLTQVPHHL